MFRPQMVAKLAVTIQRLLPRHRAKQHSGDMLYGMVINQVNGTTLSTR